uniref:RING-type domain-containing protein n=1 Tax=viral metagenome TaxID=1070528 RepID=A0A6C0ET83_9ZZZZ
MESSYNTNPTTLSSSSETTCSICMENITDLNKTTTQCGHVFHSSCIFKNLNFRTSCPMCRIDLVSKNNAPTTIPRQTTTNSNININNINYIYNFPSAPSRTLMDDDIINALLQLESPRNENEENTSFEDYLLETQGEASPQYESPQLQYGNDIIETYRNLTQEFDDVQDANNAEETDNHAEDDNDAGDSEYDTESEDANLERYETDIPIKEVTNKMLELGYTTEDMLYFMTWRINPFYFNRQYVEKYTPEFYNTMLETMNKIFTKEISIEPHVNNVPIDNR